MIVQLVIFAVGFFLLYFGAEALVRGTALLAIKIGLSPMLISLTVVALGTSTPELIVSIVSLSQNKDMMAISNIIGSNICNLTMVLGIVALISPVTINKSIVKQDFPVIIFASILLFVLSIDSIIGKLDGLILTIGAISYISFKYFGIKKNKKANITECNPVINFNKVNKKHLIKHHTFTISIGIFFLTAGAKLLVNAAIQIMTILGINEKCIGLTVMAIGTSIPELATSIVAATRKQMDISIGTLIGSNIFNILSVIGITTVIHPIIISSGFVETRLAIDYIIMIFISIFLLMLMRKKLNISKFEGITLLLLYMSYIIISFQKT